MEGPETRPTYARWTILSFVFLISVVTVVDRVNISVAAQYIMPEYGLSQVQMGTIFSAFIVGYTLSFIPGGWLGDRFGPRRVLTGALLAWSFLTVVTAWAGDIFLASLFGVVGSFLCIRFLFGMGEGPAYPNANRLAANWFPLTEKALATSAGLSVRRFPRSWRSGLVGRWRSSAWLALRCWLPAFAHSCILRDRWACLFPPLLPSKTRFLRRLTNGRSQQDNR